MELQAKSKYFGFKSKKQNPKDLQNWFGNPLDADENEIFENLESNAFQTKDVPRTPVRSLYYNSISPISQNSSPQFKVGWNDGSQKNACDMSSPVSMLPVRRKIRRCPENLLSKISSPSKNSEKRKTDDENGCDILQCINWAKNLIESTSTNCQSSDHEDDQSFSENMNKMNESNKDTAIDILDDSSNELMILCSQAIEERISTGSVLPNNAQNSSSIKHSITPLHDKNCKRVKYCSSPSKKEIVKKQSGNSSLKNENKEQNIFPKPTQTYINNNNANVKNFNKGTNISKIGNHVVKKPIILDSSLNRISTQSNLSVSAINNDDIKSHLDDEDDVFCSLDFNFLDSLQTQSAELLENAPKPVVFNLGKPSSKNCEPLRTHNKSQVTKYTKEEIEKRRLEAKKRLLFNKKHRSM